MIHVHLYGKYRRIFGKVFKLNVSDFPAAVRLLEANFPGKFARAIRDDKFYVARGPRIGRHVNVNDVEMLKLSAPDGEHFHLIPQAVGAANSQTTTMRQKGLGALLLGTVILGASFLFGFTPGIYAGLSLILGGASLLITPDLPSDNEDKAKSYAFNGPLNITAQGATNPLIYGRVRAGSVVAAGAIDAINVDKN